MPQNNKQARKQYNARKYLESKGLKKDLNNIVLVQSIEVNLINEYKRMLEYQTTHSAYMVWITKITRVHEHIAKIFS